MLQPLDIVSEETFLTVTFLVTVDPETFEPVLLDRQGVLDPANYVLTNSGGGVPITALAVTIVDATAALPGSNVTSSIVGASSLAAVPSSLFPWVNFAGGAEVVATATVRSSVTQVRIEVNKPTDGALYALQVRNLREFLGGAPYEAEATFEASSSHPSVTGAEQLDEGQVLVTFSDEMRIDGALLSPAEYSITGPTKVRVTSVQTAAANQVLLYTVGLSTGNYLVEVNAAVATSLMAGSSSLTAIGALSLSALFDGASQVSATADALGGTTAGVPVGSPIAIPRDIAGNLMDLVLNHAAFSGSPALSARSIFTDHGPISKPELILQSGATGSITSAVQVSLPGASLNASLVGLYLRLTGTANAGTYQVTSVVSPTVARVRASFSIPDAADGSIVWDLVDPRHGMIADDPADVTVMINDAPVIPEAVIGLLGQVVLSSVPAPDDEVLIDYSWVQNPVVDLRRLNSKEFRLNNWNRDVGRPADSSGHKYRYNNTLLQPESFVALDIRAAMEQPQRRDLKYRAYERAYSVALNDPSLLLLNSPNHRIAFPPMSRTLQSTFVNYQGTTLPEAAPVDPWVRHGAGQALVSGTDLVVTDDSTGAFPDGNPIFWTRAIDLTFDHVFAVAWRMRIEAVPAPEGVFTGVAAGYSDAQKAVIVGFLEGGKFGILRRGFGNDPSSLAAWTGGVDNLGNATGAPSDVDWAVLRGYRIFRDRSGTISVYVDGSIVPSLKVASEDLPYLEELNAPFNELQGPFFGSLSREAANTSVWSFVRYTAIPLNPLQAAPSVYVSYEGTTPPEAASQPWTPVGFHGTETIITGSHLLLDSTSATDLPSASAAGLISGDFRGYTRIEPLLSESFDTVLDLNVGLRTHTHGITPNALMAAIDDGDRLIQLCFLADKAYPKLSYGGRALPPDFEPYAWIALGTQRAAMVGQYLQISDSSTTDGLVYACEDLLLVGDPGRVLGHLNDYMLEFRVNVLSYTPDMAGFVGVMSSAYDSLRAVGVQLIEVAGQRYVELHSDGVPISAPEIPGGIARFAFDWFGDFHTFRVVKSTSEDQVSLVVSLFVDGLFKGSVSYDSFAAPIPSLTGMASFGSSTPLSVQARSVAVWAYSNYWRCDQGARKYVGLWKGRDPTSLTGYHLPISVAGRAASVAGNVLTDLGADFVASGVQSGDQLVIDEGLNKGVYSVQVVAPGSDETKLTITQVFPNQPSEVGYRVAMEVDWSAQHQYRIVKGPSGGVSVFMDDLTLAQPELVEIIHADYSNTALPPNSAGIPRVISSGLPSVTWGAFDPTNLSQSSWDYVRLSAVRSLSEVGIVPHHQILNQRNIMASFEHHRTNIPHPHTNYWSESEGIPPQTEPDLLRDPNLVAFTLLNDRTPLVPSTQTYEVRSPMPVLVPVVGLGQPGYALNTQSFLLNSGEQRVQIVVPDDVLYNSLQVIERSTGSPDLIAPFDDESEPNFGPLFFQKEVCLSYDGSALPENDNTASTPWRRVSEVSQGSASSIVGGVLTDGSALFLSAGVQPEDYVYLASGAYVVESVITETSLQLVKSPPETVGAYFIASSRSEAPHQSASAFSGVLTYGTDSTGTRTLYRNNTPLPDSIGLRTEVKFRLKLLQDSSLGLGDSQVRVGFSSPGVTVGLAFVTTSLGQRYVLAVDLNNGQTVGGIAFDFYDGAYHDYRLVRDPGTATVQIFIDA